ncbi:MAG: glycerol-3-phosphate acyltransferase [Acidimicrobiia bacterium]
MSLVVVAVLGYLLGSIPIAVLVGRRHGIELRTIGDRNPGYWNAKELLGGRAALPVLVGDVAKGAAAAALGRWLGDAWWIGDVAAAAAMLGHAWPLFAGFRGGRSILTFAGAVCVLSPVAAGIAIGACVVVALASRRSAYGARVGVFGFPVAQAFVDPREHVAATGALMCIIGLRFLLAARTTARTTAQSVTRSAGRQP